MFEIGSLMHQRTSLQVRLVKPLPLSTLEAADGSDSETPPFSGTVLMPELLAYEGDFAPFSSLMWYLNRGPRSEKVAAVTQAAGSGKTKLAFEYGMRDSLVIFIRIGAQGHQSGCGLTAPWRAFVKLARQLEAARNAEPPAVKVQHTETAFAAMRLLLCSYVEWVALVLKAFTAKLAGSGARGGAGNKASGTAGSGAMEVAAAGAAPPVNVKHLQEAALRCLHSKRGEEGVAALFRQRLAELSSATPPLRYAYAAGGASASVPVAAAAGTAASPADLHRRPVYLCYREIESHAWAVVKSLQSLLGEGGLLITMWCDEVQALMGRQQRLKEALPLPLGREHYDDAVSGGAGVAAATAPPPITSAMTAKHVGPISGSIGSSDGSAVDDGGPGIGAAAAADPDADADVDVQPMPRIFTRWLGYPEDKPDVQMQSLCYGLLTAMEFFQRCVGRDARVNRQPQADMSLQQVH